MDPLSIAASSTALAVFAVKASYSIYTCIDDVNSADNTLLQLEGEVDALTTGLKSISSTFESQEVIQLCTSTNSTDQSQSTKLLLSVKPLLTDCKKTLQKLVTLLNEIEGKPGQIRMLKKPVRALKINLKSRDIELVRHQIRSYSSAMQMTLHMVAICLSVDGNKHAETMGVALSQQLARLSVQIADVQQKVSETNDTHIGGDHSLVVDEQENNQQSQHMEEYIQSAKIILSNASIYHGSVSGTFSSVMGLNDEQRQRVAKWLPGEQSLQDDEIDDDDDDFDITFFDTRLKIAREKMEAKEYKAAEAHFRRCLATEKVIKTIPGHEIIELKLELASVCQASGNASAQQAIFLELLQLELPKLQEFHLQHSLAMAYLGNGELDLARTHAETAMRGRRKILGRRHECYYETLTLLVDICIADNNVDDAEVYNHLLPRNCHQEATLSLAALSRDNVAQEASESRKESLSTNVDQPADLVSIKLLAENGYDIDNKEIYFEALKWTFGHSDRRDVARLLLERGTDIKGKDILGNEMLHYAAFWGFKDIASDLIVRGANVHAKTNLGNTPLHKARGVATTSMLLDAGANIESINLSGATPLISSASHGNDDKLQLLIFRGANVHAKTIRGNTSLHVARSVATTGILLTAGANIKSINNSGATPLMITASYGEDDKLQLLISRGARVDATDGQGSTALMYASGADRLQTVLLLIDNGANIQAKDSGGYAVKSYVKKSGSNSKEILRLLDSRRPKGKRSFFQIRSWKPKT